jgi:hypothetical protein
MAVTLGWSADKEKAARRVRRAACIVLAIEA